MNRIPQFGDIMICNYPNTQSKGEFDGTYKPRPVTIDAPIYDEHGELIGFSVFINTTPKGDKKNHSSHLHTYQEDWNGKTNGKDTITQSENITFLPIHLFDTDAGIIASLKTEFLPDLIACRVIGLNRGKDNRYINYIDHGGEIYREGIYFKEELLQPIQPSYNPDCQRPDVELQPYTLPQQGLSADITQSDIDAITRWTVAYNKIHTKNEWTYQSPPKGTWPNWADIEIDGEIIKCCSKAKAATRDYQPENPPHFFSDRFKARSFQPA